MTEERHVAVGRVGRAHGRDGSFWVETPEHPLEVGTDVRIGGLTGRVERRDGGADRALLRVSGVEDREAAAALSGKPIDVEETAAPLGEEEWLVEDLVGCQVPGIGEVVAVLAGPSCDLLEVGERGVLVPLVSDAVRRVDLETRVIEVDHEFLALSDQDAEGSDR
ncbi:MAG: ribosome maturation factor RimM [Thermoleophilaceae bacterium]